MPVGRRRERATRGRRAEEATGEEGQTRGRQSRVLRKMAAHKKKKAIVRWPYRVMGHVIGRPFVETQATKFFCVVSTIDIRSAVVRLDTSLCLFQLAAEFSCIYYNYVNETI
jgi:hypothetical protein